MTWRDVLVMAMFFGCFAIAGVMTWRTARPAQPADCVQRAQLQRCEAERDILRDVAERAAGRAQWLEAQCGR